MFTTTLIQMGQGILYQAMFVMHVQQVYQDALIPAFLKVNCKFKKKSNCFSLMAVDKVTFNPNRS